MHAKQLAALGGWIASRANEIIQLNELDVESQTEYWVNSRDRLQRWHSTLKMFHSDVSEPQPQHDPWHAIQVVTQEVLVTELLTRVWSTVLLEFSHRTGDRAYVGIANGTFVGHVEARNRAIQLLIRCQGIQPKHVARLNRLRNRIERWTDLWLGFMDVSDKRNRFAFEPARVLDFQFDSERVEANERLNEVNEADEAQMMLSSFTSTLNLESVNNPANPDLNREIASNIVCSIPTNQFDILDMPEETWMLKIEKSHKDVQSLISQLISQETSAPI